MYALIDISNQMLEDSAFDMEGEIRGEATEQFAVKEGAKMLDRTACLPRTRSHAAVSSGRERSLSGASIGAPMFRSVPSANSTPKKTFPDSRLIARKLNIWRHGLTMRQSERIEREAHRRIARRWMRSTPSGSGNRFANGTSSPIPAAMTTRWA